MNVWYAVARYLLIFSLAYAMFFLIYPFQVTSMSMCSFTLILSFSPVISTLVQIRKYKIYETQTFYRTDRFIEDWFSYSRKEISTSPEVLLTGDEELDNAVLQYNTASFKLTPVSTKKQGNKLIEDGVHKSSELFKTVKKVVEDVSPEEEGMQTAYPKDEDPTVYPKDNEKDDDNDDDDDDDEEDKKPPTTLPPPTEKSPRPRSSLLRRSLLRNRTSERGRVYRYSFSWRRRHSSPDGHYNRTAEAARRRREWQERRARREAASSSRRHSLPYSNEKWKTVRKQRERLDLYAKPGSAEFRRDAVKHILNYKERGICAEGRCRKFVGGVEVPYNYSTACRAGFLLLSRAFLSGERGRDADHDRFVEKFDGIHWQTEPISIHRQVSSSVGRVVSSFLLSCSPMCIVVWVHDFERDEILAQMPSLQNPINLTMILYEPTDDELDYYDFPINKLRNLCIRNIQTSHFLTLDLDMWPTRFSVSRFPL